MNLYLGTIGDVNSQYANEIGQQVLEIEPFDRIFSKVRNYEIPPIRPVKINFCGIPMEALTLEELAASSCLVDRSIETPRFVGNDRLLVLSRNAVWYRTPAYGMLIENFKSLTPEYLKIINSKFDVLGKGEKYVHFVEKSWEFSRGIANKFANIAVGILDSEMHEDVETSAHELGHTFGLMHHPDKMCLMKDSESIPRYFCESCRQEILDYTIKGTFEEKDKIWLEHYLFSKIS